jgi:hypothetical protein
VLEWARCHQLQKKRALPALGDLAEADWVRYPQEVGFDVSKMQIASTWN